MTEPAGALHWTRTSRYSARAGDYAVSLTLGPTAASADPATRRYLVWHGPPLAEMPRGYCPEMIGTADTWPAAACIAQAHADAALESGG
jgi:hypothetical protein